MIRKLEKRYIAKGLRDVLRDRGITQISVARALNLHTSNISAIANGRLVIGPKNAERIAEYLNLPLEALFMELPPE